MPIRRISAIRQGLNPDVRYAYSAALRLPTVSRVNQGRLMKNRSHDEVMAALFQAVPSCAQALLVEVGREGGMVALAILERQLSVSLYPRGHLIERL